MIVVVSSMQGRLATPYRTAYAASARHHDEGAKPCHHPAFVVQAWSDFVICSISLSEVTFMISYLLHTFPNNIHDSCTTGTSRATANTGHKHHTVEDRVPSTSVDVGEGRKWPCFSSIFLIFIPDNHPLQARGDGRIHVLLSHHMLPSVIREPCSGYQGWHDSVMIVTINSD